MSTQSDDIMDSMRYLMAALEADMYLGQKHQRKPYAGLFTLLAKLGIKSAMLDNRPFQFESLEATLKSVTFDDTHLKKWPTIKKPCKACPTKKCKNCPHKAPTQV